MRNLDKLPADVREHITGNNGRTMWLPSSDETRRVIRNSEGPMAGGMLRHKQGELIKQRAAELSQKPFISRLFDFRRRSQQAEMYNFFKNFDKTTLAPRTYIARAIKAHRRKTLKIEFERPLFGKWHGKRQKLCQCFRPRPTNEPVIVLNHSTRPRARRCSRSLLLRPDKCWLRGMGGPPP
jgi:hypothetical protein